MGRGGEREVIFNLGTGTFGMYGKRVRTSIHRKVFSFIKVTLNLL